MKPSRLRLVSVLVAVAGIAALVAQNPTPVLGLTFLGWQTLALPLALWLLLALGAGALTVLALTLIVLHSPARPKYRPAAYSRISEDPDRPQPEASRSAYRAGPGEAREYQGESYMPEAEPEPSPDSYRDYMPPDPMGSRATDDSEWGAWTQLRSPVQREDWDQPAPSTDFVNPPRTSSPSTGGRSGRGATSGLSGWNLWPFGNSTASQQERAEESFQDLAEGWDGVENPDYRPEGGSPVQDALEDIDQGWDGPGEGAYAYGYGQEESRRDHVYGPPDDDQDGVGEADEAYEAETEDAGVVDADYRVIIPPYSAAEADEPGDDPDEDWIEEKPS